MNHPDALAADSPGLPVATFVAAPNAPADELRMSVIEETLTVDKRMIETGRVRLVKTVHADEQTVSVPLLAEEVVVERVAMDELVEVAPPTRQEGETTVYSVLKEEYVVVKRLRLVEEIRVTRRQVATVHDQTVVLRREEVRVEREPAQPTPNYAERSDASDASSL